MNKSIKKLSESFYNMLPMFTAAALVTLLYSVISGIVSQHPFFFCDSPHDFFIPVSIGYAFKSGYALHQDFYTPFGWLYGAVNAAGLHIISLFPDTLSLNSFLSIGSFIFVALASFIFAVIWYISPRHFSRNLFMIFVLALSVIFQFKGRMDNIILDFAPVTRSIYNNHLWGLILIQLTHIFIMVNMLGKGELSKRFIIISAIIQACIVYIFLSYKISFFLGAAIIAGAFSLILPARLMATYMLAGALALIALVAITFLSGYSYVGYIGDIQSALSAKKIMYDAYIQHWDELKKLSANIPVYEYWDVLIALIVSLIMTKYYQLQSIASEVRSNSYRMWLFFFLFAFASTIIIQGDYDRPHLYFAISILIFAIINPIRNYSKHISAFANIAFICMVFLSTLSIILSNNNRGKEVIRTSDFALDASHFGHRLHFTLVNKLPEDGGSGDIIFSKDDPLLNTYELVIPDYLKFYKYVSDTGNYARMIKEIMATLTELDIKKHEKLFLIEFSNPLPFLTNSQIPKQSLNWLHMGVTLNPESLGVIHPAIADSNVVVIPTRTLEGNAGQRLNCEFYEWNFSNNQKFKIFKISESAIYLGDDEFLQKRNLPPVHNFDDSRAKITDSCAEVKTKFREYLWLYPT